MPQKLAIDIREAAQASRFPKHGWAWNSQGYRKLWLPVLTLVWKVNSDEPEAGRTEALALRHLVENLCVTLRELHGCQRRVREVCEAFPVETLRDAQLASLYTDLAYVYLRRIADRTADAIRYVLFDYPQNAPRKMKVLRKKLLTSGAELSHSEGLKVDVTEFQNILKNNLDWFDELSSGGEQKGLRDQMEHWPISPMIGTLQSGISPIEIVALFQQSKPGEVLNLVELIGKLRGLIEELSIFWTNLCILYPGFAAGYDECEPQTLSFVGIDVDTVGFWPEL